MAGYKHYLKMIRELKYERPKIRTSKEVKMSNVKPLPIPEGMTKEEIDAVKVDEGDWRKSDEFVCCSCGEPAYLHPYTNQIWGCKKCGYTTYSVSVYFRPVHIRKPNVG